MAEYTFGNVVWGITAKGNSTCAQAGIKYEQVENTKTHVKFKVSGCMRSGDGTRLHFNRYFYVTVNVQYRLDGTGAWKDLGSVTGSTDYNLNYNPPGLETPATGWLYTPSIERQESSSKRLIEFRTYVPKGAFNSDAYASTSVNINPKESYSIQYNPGISTSAPPSQTKYYNKDLILTDKTPATVTGYTFKNWNTKLDGSGISYKKKAVYKENKAVTLYAQYEPNKYTVYYDYNYENKPEPFKQTVTYSQNWTTIAGPQRDKYWFVNWNTNSTGTGTSYSPAINMGIYNVANNSTYYAQWTPSVYAINYYSNVEDASIKGIPKSQTKTSGEDRVLSDAIPTRAGYDFIYWSSSKTGETPTYTPNTIYKEDKELNLYTTWIPAYCAVTYNGNVPNGNIYPVSPTSLPSTANVQRDLKWTIENKTPIRQYHTFKGWYTNSAATGTAYYPSNRGPIITTATTLYAEWSRDQYSVVYNKNGGTTAPLNVTESCGVDTIISGDASRASTTQSYVAKFVVTADVNGVTVGKFSDNSTAPMNLWGYATTTYNLANWNTKEDGSGTTYSIGGSYQGTKDNILSLYAQWNVYPPSALPTVTPPEVGDVENYVFKGWYRRGNLIPTLLPEATSFTFDSDYIYKENNTPTTLYASWIPTTYTVRYTNIITPTDANIINMPTSEEIYKLSAEYTIPENIPIWQFKETEDNKNYKVIYNYQYGNNVTEETVGKRKEFIGWMYSNEQKDTPDPLYRPNEIYPALTTTAGAVISLAPYWGEEINASQLITPPNREGYSFAGWFKDPNYTELPNLDANGLLLPTEDRSDIVLYAKWIPWVYRIEYSDLSQYNMQEWPYGSSGIKITEERPIKNPTTNTYGVYFEDNWQNNILNSQFEVTKTYSFNNWSVENSKNNTVYTPSQEINDAFSSSNEAIGILDDTGIFKGYLLNLKPNWDITLTTPTLSFPEQTDENFVGWKIYSLKKDANEKWQKDEELAFIDKNTQEYIPPDCDIAIYPIIESDKWSITYNANSGYFNENETIIVDSNSPTTIANYLPFKEDFKPIYTVNIHNEQNISQPEETISIEPHYKYTFTGWNSIKDGSGIEYEVNQEVNGNLVLYAQWEEELIDGTETILLNTSELEGYTFGGWYSDFRFINLISSDFSYNYKPTKNIDIYAKWTTKKYQIDYNINGGKEKTRPNSRTKLYNEDIILSNKIPTYSDHIFMGWQGELKSPTSCIEEEDKPLDNIKTKKINDNSIQLEPFYALSNSDTIAPEENWETTKIEPTINMPYLWAKIKITWPESEIEYTTAMYIGEQYHYEILEEYGLIIGDASPSYITDWTTQRPIRAGDENLYERVTVKWVTDMLQPKDIYTWNRSIVLTAQWREIKTLTEWLSNWETTPASENEPGNELTLRVNENETVNSYQNISELLNAVYKINNTESYVYGQGYKLRLDLINPYGDINSDTNKIERLTRTIFVPAKPVIDEEAEEIIGYTGYYEIPAGIKIAEASVYDGAQVNISYQAHMNLDYVDVNMPDFYEITEQTIGQINGLQTPNQNITALLKSKYYAKDTNETTIYEHSLDSWHIDSIEGPIGTEFEISTINNPTLIVYQLDSNGLFIKETTENKKYLDLDEQINQCIFKGILNENNEYIVTPNITNGLIINYRATIAQRVYI